MTMKYPFSDEVSRKLKSIKDIPLWIKEYPDFTIQLKIIREALGMTQEQLAKASHCSARQIRKIESGEDLPKLATIRQLAKALNTELHLVLIPKQPIQDYLEIKALEKASKLVALSSANSALELQGPDKAQLEQQIQKTKDDILKAKRSILWQ